MSYRLRLTPQTADELQRLFDFLAQQDAEAAERARLAIEKAFRFLESFPFACRKACDEFAYSCHITWELPRSAVSGGMIIDLPAHTTT